MITDDTLAELDAAERAATKAGWQTHLRNPFSIDCEVSILTETGGTLFRSTSYGKMRQDGDFIALTRNHMRELLDEVLSHRNGDGSFWKEFFRADNENLRRQNAQYLFEADKLRAALMQAKAEFSVIDYVDRSRGYPTGKEWMEIVRVVKQSIKRIDDTLGDG